MYTNIPPKKGKKGRFWWWLLILFCLVALGLGFYYYFIYPKTDKTPEKVAVTQKIRSVEAGDEFPESLEKEQMPTEVSPDEALRKQMEYEVEDFFLYLNKKEYIRRLDASTDPCERFVEIYKRLAATTPIPAGEDETPEFILKNLYHFFRILTTKDIRIVTEIIRQEQDTMEVILETFYKWHELGGRFPCAEEEVSAPSKEISYQYASFLLNTTGGRAYLYRRAPHLRLLVTYYCVLIIYEADMAGTNTNGIDILPYVKQVKSEISRYTDFQFQQAYIDRLNQIESYYMEKRGSES